MSTKSSVDLRAELAELVKRKAEIAVSTVGIFILYEMKCTYTIHSDVFMYVCDVQDS